jgi:hypothetical protein
MRSPRTRSVQVGTHCPRKALFGNLVQHIAHVPGDIQEFEG